jgi:hypothetical protein
MSKLIKIVVLAGFLYLPIAVQADPLVSINFDTPLPSGSYLSQGLLLNTLLVNPLTGQADTVIAGIVLLPSPAAVSPPQAAFPFPGVPFVTELAGIEGSFFLQTSDFHLLTATTGLVSFNVVGSQGDWTALFFDATNRSDFDLQTGLIGTITGNTDQLVVFSYAAGIHRFVLIPSTHTVTGIDNLQFQQPSIPEPSSVLLLILGVGGLLARKGRERFHKSLK